MKTVALPEPGDQFAESTTHRVLVTSRPYGNADGTWSVPGLRFRSDGGAESAARPEVVEFTVGANTELPAGWSYAGTSLQGLFTALKTV